MTGPHFTLAQLTRWAATAALLAAGMVVVLVAWFDPFGVEARRIDAATRQATTVVLCAQVATYRQRLDQLGAIVAAEGTEGLTRNERDVLATVTDSMGRLRAAERLLQVRCTASDDRGIR